ncbi:hypothetical protein GCM10023264_18500 [Sphingomonas daechungensis]
MRPKMGARHYYTFPAPRVLLSEARGPRHRPQVHRQELEQAIKGALAAGWEPSARGKAFHFDV